MGDTNATPVPVNPSRFATIKSSEEESPPSLTTLVVRYLLHYQLCHRHNGQHSSCWCWSRLSTLPPVDPFTKDLVIGRSWMFLFESLAHSSMVGGNERNTSLVFSADERGARTGLNSWTIAAKYHWERVENLIFPVYLPLTTHVWPQYWKMWARSWNAAW